MQHSTVNLPITDWEERAPSPHPDAAYLQGMNIPLPSSPLSFSGCFQHMSSTSTLPQITEDAQSLKHAASGDFSANSDGSWAPVPTFDPDVFSVQANVKQETVEALSTNLYHREGLIQANVKQEQPIEALTTLDYGQGNPQPPNLPQEGMQAFSGPRCVLPVMNLEILDDVVSRLGLDYTEEEYVEKHMLDEPNFLEWNKDKRYRWNRDKRAEYYRDYLCPRQTDHINFLYKQISLYRQITRMMLKTPDIMMFNELIRSDIEMPREETIRPQSADEMHVCRSPNEQWINEMLNLNNDDDYETLLTPSSVRTNYYTR